jgi:tRNA pseudouridine55 synthase
LTVPDWLRREGAILVVDKPPECTSFSVVAEVRRLLGGLKVGHTGTLDPLATGVLPLVLGPATRLAELLTGSRKLYRAVFRLGLSTDTEDITGRVTAERPLPADLDRELVESVLARFRGEILQRAPMYSARKVGGRRLYRLAREGREVERPVRRVCIEELVLESLAPPELGLRVRCSAGTYIRTLGAEIGEALGCGATMVSLRRLESGGFGLERAWDLASLRELAARGAWEEALVRVPEHFRELPELVVAGAAPHDARRFRLPPGALEAVRRAAPALADHAGFVRLLDPRRKLIAIAQLFVDSDGSGSYTRSPHLRARRVLWRAPL